MKLLNFVFKTLMYIFGIITGIVACIPFGLTQLFGYLDEITDK